MATFAHSFNEDSSYVETVTPEMPCGKVPVLLTTWHLWVFSSVKSEIQMVYLQCPGFLAQFFRKLECFCILIAGDTNSKDREIN